MAKDISKIALGIAMIAIGGAWLLNRRKSESPSLLNGDTYYYSELDMKDNERLPLGYRSNNPLNIRYVAGQNWKGKVTPPAVGKYGTYERFRDLVYGYRAALVLLRGDGYINKGINTIRKIITKFAPAEDHNYTENYIANVSKLTGIDPDVVIARNDKDKLTKIVYAMSICENGYKDKDGNDIKTTYGLPNMEIINDAWGIL